MNLFTITWMLSLLVLSVGSTVPAQQNFFQAWQAATPNAQPHSYNHGLIVTARMPF
jgi:hypothetical protein